MTCPTPRACPGSFDEAFEALPDTHFVASPAALGPLVVDFFVNDYHPRVKFSSAETACFRALR